MNASKLSGIFKVLLPKKGSAATPQPAPTVDLPPERRGTPRRYGDPVSVLFRDAYNYAEPTKGLVIDRSSAGVGLSVAEPVDEGRTLSVGIALAESVPWVLVEVKHCRPLAGRWLLGCRYVAPPPSDVLVMFR